MHQGFIPALIKIGGTHADAHEAEAAGHGPVAEDDSVSGSVLRRNAGDTVQLADKIHMLHSNPVIGCRERAATGIYIIIAAYLTAGYARHAHKRKNTVDVRTAAVGGAGDGDRVVIRCFRSKYANHPGSLSRRICEFSFQVQGLGATP